MLSCMGVVKPIKVAAIGRGGRSPVAARPRTEAPGPLVDVLARVALSAVARAAAMEGQASGERRNQPQRAETRG